MSLVVDASVAVKWYVPEMHTEQAALLLDQETELHVPDLFFSEFGNILWKKVNRNEIDAEESHDIVRALRLLPINTHAGSDLLPAALDLATHTSRTVYDCMYVSLAVALNSELVTADERLFNALASTAVAENVVLLKDMSTV